MRKAIIKSGLEALYFSGAHRVMRHFVGGVGAILMLHHVRPARRDGFQPNQLLEITPDFLEAVVARLDRMGVDFVSLDEVHRRLSERDFGRRFVAFTFDDGYRDNKEWAYPILKRHGVPFAVYVPTSFPDRLGELWWAALEAVIAGNASIVLEMDGRDCRVDCATPAEKFEAFDLLYRWLRAMPSEAKMLDTVRELARRYGVDSAAICDSLCMTWDEVAEIAADPLVTIGAHTVNHVMLAKACDTVTRSELKMGRAVLEAARVRDRGRARLQDRGDDPPGRAVPGARADPDGAAAHLDQRRVPARPLHRRAALRRRHGAVERPALPAGRLRLQRGADVGPSHQGIGLAFARRQGGNSSIRGNSCPIRRKCRQFLPEEQGMTISSITSTSATDASASVNPLLKGRHTPDFSQAFSLSAEDEQVLSIRGLDQDRRTAVGEIYAEARSAVQGGQAKSFLAGLDTQSLVLLQKAASLAAPVDVASLSEEGAENLLLAPTEGVDLNGDGMVQTGAALGFTFPPVDASPALRAAWEKTIAGTSNGDALTLSLMIGGPSIPVDGSAPRGRDFSGDFDWNSYLKDLVAGNDASRPYNTAETYQKIDGQLHAFWSALKDQGLA